jgi:hypothetical protein
MSKMIHTDIRIYQERKRLMRNLKGMTGRTEKTKHFLSTDTHKKENMLNEQGIYVDTDNTVGTENLLPLKIQLHSFVHISCY